MSEPKSNDLMEKIVSLCKRRGFIFQSSEIYGGINGFWDYGPLGAELKRNVKDLWWRSMTQLRDDVVGLEATIIMHPKIWEASGHTSTFSDTMVDCLLTKKRFRADQIEPENGVAYDYLGAIDHVGLELMVTDYLPTKDQSSPPDWAKSARELENLVPQLFGAPPQLTEIPILASVERPRLKSLLEFIFTSYAKLCARPMIPAVLYCGDSISFIEAKGTRHDRRKNAQRFYGEKGLKAPIFLLSRVETVQ